MGCGGSTAVQYIAGFDYYKIPGRKCLGDGASCQVYIAKSKHEKDKEYALKVLDSRKEENLGLWQQEVDILTQANPSPFNPYVLDCKDSFKGPKSLYIVTSLCTGGELFDKVVSATVKTEKLLASYTKMMLLGLAHCHKQNIVHRDLKPENFLFTDKTKDAKIVLIDFGCAFKVQDESEVVEGRPGTFYYIAPETLAMDKPMTGQMWKAADTWAVGIILYMLLVGRPPFDEVADASVFKCILTRKYPPIKKSYSSHAKDFIHRLLNKDWQQRLTTAQALAHPWLVEADEIEIDASIFEQLSNFKEQCELQKAVAKVLSGRMGGRSEEKVAELFNKFDANDDGFLDSTELCNLMNFVGKGGGQAADLLAAADEDGNGNLDLAEFKTLHTNIELTKKTDEELATLFKEFDPNGDGMLSATEIADICKIDIITAEKLIAEADNGEGGNQDGMINCQEWITALQRKTKK